MGGVGEGEWGEVITHITRSSNTDVPCQQYAVVSTVAHIPSLALHQHYPFVLRFLHPRQHCVAPRSVLQQLRRAFMSTGLLYVDNSLLHFLLCYSHATLQTTIR